MNDELGICLKSLISALDEAKIPIVEGYLSDEPNLSEVCLHYAPVATAGDRFAEAAVSLSAKYVVINSQQLTDEELREALEDAEAEGDADALAILKRCKASVGHVGYIKALFMLPHPPSIVSIELFAPWHEHVYASIDDLEEDGPDSRRHPSEAELSGYANTLAHDPKFQGAKNQDSRMYVAKTVLADKLEELRWHIGQVVAEAKSIYEIDIKPHQNSSVATNPRDMVAR